MKTDFSEKIKEGVRLVIVNPGSKQIQVMKTKEDYKRHYFMTDVLWEYRDGLPHNEEGGLLNSIFTNKEDDRLVYVVTEEF